MFTTLDTVVRLMYNVPLGPRYGHTMAKIKDSAQGARMRRQRGAHAANRSMRAQGRVPGAEGRARAARNLAERAQRDRDAPSARAHVDETE
jgi:hypothetical protein